MSADRPTKHVFHPATLRAYDIRGEGDRLGEADAYAVGRSFGTIVVRAGGSRIAVGRDGRHSSPRLEAALLRGLADAGVRVLRIGLGPTPMLYFAEQALQVDGGIQITGSHNPRDHNGFKLVHQHRPFFGQAIQQLGEMATLGDWASGTAGVEDVVVMDAYVARLIQDFDGAAYRIGWDAGNGAAGPVVDKLIQLLPGQHHAIFTDIDGDFPNHHPDPVDERNLAQLRALVMDKKLDFGVAFDGDGDRIGVVDGQGRVIDTDRLLAILAAPILQKQPSATIIADVKASATLFERIARLGGVPLMWKTGHSLIKSKMEETGAALAGETGHIYFGRPDYLGFDDGLYAAVRLIRAVTWAGRSLCHLHDALPRTAIIPELRIPVAEDRKLAVVEEISARLIEAGTIVDRTDGLRVSAPQGWWLLRASNTESLLVVRAESADAEGLGQLIAAVDSRLCDCGVEGLNASLAALRP